MLITKHGKKDPLFKGVSAFNASNGKPAVFFGWTKRHVIRKEAEWLEVAMPVSEARDQRKPLLRLVSA